MSESTPPSEEKTCPFAGAKKVIDWFNVVDDFKIKEHSNFLPRWAFLVVVLSVMALT
jgi:hypothetical protein